MIRYINVTNIQNDYINGPVSVNSINNVEIIENIKSFEFCNK